MATATIAKSEFRKNLNITIGYGEVPGMECEETGQVRWGLPGGAFTTCKEEAIRFAHSLDETIRANLKSVNQLFDAQAA